MGLRNGSTRWPRIPVLVTPEWNSCSESNNFSHVGDVECQGQEDEMFVDAPDIFQPGRPPVPLSTSLDSISPAPSIHTAANVDKIPGDRLTLDKELSLDERMACSSQELAKQRARYRQRYMDTTSVQASYAPLTPCEQLQASVSLPQPGNPTSNQDHVQSFVDSDTATCIICML